MVYMKTTEKDFELFKITCKEWLEKLQLSDWCILYEHKEIGNLGQSTLNEIDGLATITLTIDFGDDILNDEAIKEVARHECLHILVAELARLAKNRYITANQVRQAEEHLVLKLERLIK